MNSWHGIGNLGLDPELRTTANGRNVLNLNLAVDRHYWSGDEDDKHRVDTVDWIPIVIWGTLAKNCARYLQKGSKISVEGELRRRDYIDADGTKHKSFEVVANRVDFVSGIRLWENGRENALAISER